MDSAVIVGGGTMGSAVAAIFQAAGWLAQVVESGDSARSTLSQRITADARLLGAKGDEPVARIYTTLGEIDWSRVALVIECVYEDLPLKQRVFKELEAACPAAIPLTSNSSSFPISQIGQGLETLPRMLGLHFFMPAHLVPAVEVVCHPTSDPAVPDKVSAIMRKVGKHPVRVKRDVPGFLANRIQHALMREAIALVEEGFATAEDVDAAVRYGFGLRYVAAGPLLQKDLAGVDVHCAAAATMYPYLHNNAEPSPYMRHLVEQGFTGVKSKAMQGFYKWTPETIAKEQKRYETAMVKAAQILRDERDLGEESVAG